MTSKQQFVAMLKQINTLMSYVFRESLYDIAKIFQLSEKVVQE